MADPVTNEKVADVIREACPLRTVLRESKPCPYFGASGTCRDCSYDWMSVSGDVLKLVKARRAAYEKEREKNVEIKKMLAETQKDMETFRSIKHAFKAFLLFGNVILEEERDEVGSEDKGKESQEGGCGD